MADSQVDIFSKTVKWEELAPLPVGRNAHTAVLLGGNVYVGGGVEGRNYDNQNSYRLVVYNLTTNQWSSSPITTPYCWFAMTVLNVINWSLLEVLQRMMRLSRRCYF